MPEATTANNLQSPSGQMPPGTALASGQYTILAHRYSSLFAEVYQAQSAADSQTPVSVHVFRPSCHAPAALKAMQEAIAALSLPPHEGVARPMQFLAEDTPPALVTELVDGHSLRQLLARKRETGSRGFSPRGARNLFLQLLQTLEDTNIPHGALNLDSVAVDKSGHVVVTDYGLWPLLALAKGSRTDIIVAPEILVGARPSRASDVYGLGAILYELLMGTPPVKGCDRPSQALGLPTTVDELLGVCVNDDASKRITDLKQFRDQVATALAMTATQSAQRPAVARKSLAQQIASPDPAARVTGQVSVPTPEADGVERWLVSKGKLDYGPYPMSKIIADIRADQILPGHYVIDTSSGERSRIEDHPLFNEEVDRATRTRDEKRRAEAEVVHQKGEKRRGLALYGFIGAGVVALGLVTWGAVTALRGCCPSRERRRRNGQEGRTHRQDQYRNRRIRADKATRPARRQTTAGSTQRPGRMGCAPRHRRRQQGGRRGRAPAELADQPLHSEARRRPGPLSTVEQVSQCGDPFHHPRQRQGLVRFSERIDFRRPG